MKLFSKKLKKKNEYKEHSIDKFIVKFLSNIDKSSFGTKNKIFFFKELGYLLQGGIGIKESVELLNKSTDNYALKEISNTINDHIKNGKTLSYALNRMPDYFNEGDYNIVKTGEKTGNLSEILKTIADEYGYINDIKSKYIGAMIYPIILIVVGISAIIGLFVFVLPEVFSILEGFQNVNLPLSTRVLKSISDFILIYYKYILIGILAIIIFFSMVLSTNFGKKKFFEFLLGLPLIGKMTKYYYLIKFCKYLKIMFKAGMNYLETFMLLKDVLGIELYQEMIENILTGLSKGDTIYDNIKFYTHIIPPNAIALLKVGEETANLSGSMDNIIKIYEQDLNSTINSFSKLIEPVLLILIGGLVTVIAMGVFGLIFQIMEGAGI